ncbi:hypothetical protein FOB64_006156 [Candida albicans]|uniref:Uncharacterized protein n=1 Tax=Candida albicans TaxID=5476 RepID=A0A8H6BVG6_CANAX|nr:hypothetical protein FOB64_006156 [Candida albicans]
MCGINYLSDFKSSAVNNGVIHKSRKPIVPGMRIICKIDKNIHNHPHLVRQQPLANKLEDSNNNNANSSVDHNCDLIYGKDIDGGLQTHLSVPKSLLIPIPYNISLHDVCFIFDILLPFYKFFQFVKPGKTIILLNDIKKELNEVLLILKIFNINFNSIIIIDGNSLSPRFNNKFETVYFSSLMQFNVANPKTHKRHNASTDSSISSISTLASNSSFKSASMMMGGVNSGTSNNNPNTISSNKFKNDKTIKYMQLSYQDKPLCIEVLKILSAINFEREDQEKQKTDQQQQQQDKQQQDSPELAHDGIIDDYDYNYVDEYDENINEEKYRQLLINDNDSLVHSTSSTHTGSSTLQMHSQTESDPHGNIKNHAKKNEKKGKRRKVITRNYHYRDGYDDDEYGIGDNHQNKIIKQMNRLLQDDVNLNRVCYFNSDDHDNDNDYKDDNDGYEDPEDVNGDDNHSYEYKKNTSTSHEDNNESNNYEDENSNQSSSSSGNRTYKSHRDRSWAKNINACII